MQSEEARKYQRSWLRTYKGLTGNMYAKIRERCKRNGRQNDEFSVAEFRAWLTQTPIRGLFERWAKCGYQTDRRPSVDRIDPLRGYTFDNMQVITAKENRVKGDKEKGILRGKPVFQLSTSGSVIATYPSITAALKATRINNISDVVNGRRKLAAGFFWKFAPTQTILNLIRENKENV